jgi:hypothetical protein
MELLLFRLGDRGSASPRERVREVVDVGAGQRPVALVSLRVALGAGWLVIDWDAIRLPTGSPRPLALLGSMG